MSNYMNLMVSKFEYLVYILEHIDPTDDATIFINDTFIYKEKQNIAKHLEKINNNNSNSLLFKEYLKILSKTYEDVNISPNKRIMMILDLNFGIYNLKKFNEMII
ncbi:hypothetical protein [Mammaliicoccus lentus]|uniref:hypothetical protein n=1 Tax=Mammaliicoccus lentus TaxID=42858 RepID=UPI001C4E4D54|nr:hypothetical protein [Mammaliicoccus lentus]MBW0761315.1 hypothetical protein [Mammaliicoccus lentus]